MPEGVERISCESRLCWLVSSSVTPWETAPERLRSVDRGWHICGRIVDEVVVEDDAVGGG
jgi:hypothetical protein